jgi:hypothetical protein
MNPEQHNINKPKDTRDQPLKPSFSSNNRRLTIFLRSLCLPFSSRQDEQIANEQSNNITVEEQSSHQTERTEVFRRELDLTNQESSSYPELLSNAKAKGQHRIQQAELLSQQDTNKYKTNIECLYQKRYITNFIVDNPGTDYGIYTGVRGNIKRFCYQNSLEYDNKENRWTFYGVQNFKRRPSNKEYSEKRYPPGIGVFDSEVEYENTQPLPHEYIIWNQIRNLKLKYFPNSNVSLDVYRGQEIKVDKDQKIIDSFIPNAGEITFNKGDDGYFIILGTDTGKAKPNLGILFEKSISNITIKKELAMDEFEYFIKYEYDNI